ncbi:MAG: efflux RND transporter periplasmic adaptor subunit [Myxococcales bacterium]|jgi:HlyD family secretion protein|nr:efflux RND transporter periplasmic adaptor subunit [Myxococcales bacterium]
MSGQRQGRWLWGVFFLALIGAGFGLYKLLLAPKPPKLSFTTAEVAQGDVASWVTATGTLSPRVTVEVGSQISGRILELLADFNSPVTKGQLLARIDPLLFESEVASSRASVASADANVKRSEASLANARQTSNRSKSLAAKKLVAQSEADADLSKLRMAEADLAQAKAQLAQAKANLELKITNLAYTKIHSPIDGVVISRDVDVGQTVAASMQAPTLFTIAEDLRKMEIHTSVAESDVGLIEPGMTVEFNVDAYPNIVFHGEVKEVRYSPTTEQNVVTYNAVVSVENPQLKLLPGMTAQVRFKIAEATDTLLVPNVALRFKPSESFLAKARAMREAELASLGREPKPRDANMKRPPNPEERKAMNFVWVLDEDDRPRPVIVDVSITDGKNTAVAILEPPHRRGQKDERQEGEQTAFVRLKKGDRVITSYADGSQSAPAGAAQRPGQGRPRMGGFMGGPPPPR